MTCFSIPSDIRSLKEKLQVLCAVDTVILAWIPYFGILLFCIMILVIPNELELLQPKDLVLIGKVFVWLWVVQLLIVCGLYVLLEKYFAFVFYAYCFVKILFQCACINSMFALRGIPGEGSRPLAYYFCVGLIIFYVILIPYQIYELILVIYFHSLSKKIPNPPDVENDVASIVEVGVEMGVPPRGNVN